METLLENTIIVNPRIKRFENVERICTVSFYDFGYFIFIKLCEDGHRKMMKIVK